MGYLDPDPYHQPEKFGLTQVGLLADPNACWTFDYLVVWQHNDGTLYWAQDSGCSCPSPFEAYHTLGSLCVVTKENFSDFTEEVMDHCAPWSSSEADINAVDKVSLLAKVWGILRDPQSGPGFNNVPTKEEVLQDSLEDLGFTLSQADALAIVHKLGEVED